MKVIEAPLPGVLIFEPVVHGDERGFFVETYHEARYREAGLADKFVQDNMSKSQRGVLRGLHFQWPNPQGKLVSVVEGEVWDVAADIRLGSPTFGQWHAERLDGLTKRQMWVPPGFAHGFVTLSEVAIFQYKVTALYEVEHDFGVAYNDPELAIPWPIDEVQLSKRDSQLPFLRDLPEFAQPRY